MNKEEKILVVGHNSVMERSLTYGLLNKGFSQVLSATGLKLDVLDQKKVLEFFQDKKPEYIFLGSIRSGGIKANQTQGADFIYENLLSQNNIINAALVNKAKKLLFFGSSCVYPKECEQPMNESDLLTGSLEKTSEPYAVAKIAGIIMCQAFKKQHGLNAIVTVPATVYGPGIDTNLETAHVLGALITKIYGAVKDNSEEVVVWGTGIPQREFIFSDDFVDCALFLMENYEESDLINMGCGHDISIKELAELIAKIAGFKGNITFDTSKPDGAMHKRLDSGRLRGLGWNPKVDLEEGIKRTYQWYEKEMG